jgi:hypothetical protein
VSDIASEGTTAGICVDDVMDIEGVGATSHPRGKLIRMTMRMMKTIRTMMH